MEKIFAHHAKAIVKLVFPLQIIVLHVRVMNSEKEIIVNVLKVIMKMELIYVNIVLETVNIVHLLIFALNVLLILTEFYLIVTASLDFLILHLDLEEEQ